jgi:ribosomal protein L11 methyltransferase
MLEAYADLVRMSMKGKYLFSLSDTCMKLHKNPWICLEVTAPPEAAELLSCLLFEGGCRGLEERTDEAVWRALAYFEVGKPRAELTATLTDAGKRLAREIGQEVDVRVRRREILPEDWEKKWREGLSPFRAGERTVVVPSGCTYSAKEGEIVIAMDARLAFGSGHHETTKLAIRALERTVPPGSSVLDLGSGSGILALVAARLGASKVTAVEVDEVPYANMVENIEANGLGGRIKTLRASLTRAPRDRFAIVVANLDRNGLLSGMGEIAARLLPGGTALLTGFLGTDRREIEQRMKECGLTPVSCDEMGEWRLLVGILLDSTGPSVVFIHPAGR